jgi:hypothetical protein
MEKGRGGGDGEGGGLTGCREECEGLCGWRGA